MIRHLLVLIDNSLRNRKEFRPYLKKSMNYEQVIPQKSEVLFEEAAKRVYKHFKQVGDLYRISKKNKGLHRIGIVKNEITCANIKRVVDFAKENGAENIVYAQLTDSVYFSFNGKSYRISNHPKKAFEGVDILISWNTDVDLLLHYFTKA
jgi:hypothetical protein